MTYRSSVELTVQPPMESYLAQGGPFAALLRKLDGMPRVRVAVEDIAAVLWDPAEQRDDEGDCTYLLIVEGKELSVFSKLGAAQLLCWLFDCREGTRDWQERKATARWLPRIDFATKASWRCTHRLPTTQVAECSIALVPAHVTAVYSPYQAASTQCGVQLRGLATPLVLRTEWPSQSLAAWLFDAEVDPSAAQATPNTASDSPMQAST